MTRVGPAPALALALAVGLAAAARAEPRPYFRMGAGAESSRDTVVGDRNCTATSPPALFGCGPGQDGRSMGARGDFGRTWPLELAAGFEASPRARFEIALTERDGLDLDAEANFRGVSGAQPVSARARSRAALLVAAFDVGRAGWRARPFVATGVGLARNEIGAVTYAFPALGAGAVTAVRGGAGNELAWMAAAGVSVALTPALSVDVDARWTDLGEVVTDAGMATIVRPTRTFQLAIDGTTADLEAFGLVVSARWRPRSSRR